MINPLHCLSTLGINSSHSWVCPDTLTLYLIIGPFIAFFPSSTTFVFTMTLYYHVYLSLLGSSDTPLCDPQASPQLSQWHWNCGGNTIMYSYAHFTLPVKIIQTSKHRRTTQRPVFKRQQLINSLSVVDEVTLWNQTWFPASLDLICCHLSRSANVARAFICILVES